LIAGFLDLFEMGAELGEERAAERFDVKRPAFSLA